MEQLRDLYLAVQQLRAQRSDAAVRGSREQLVRLPDFVGTSRDRSASVSLADAKGQPRLKLTVDANGDPRIELLDEKARSSSACRAKAFSGSV